MKIDILNLPALDQYKLLISTIVPRPIALVGTCNLAGAQNAAPFSCFNMMGEDPPVLVLSLEARRDNLRYKHTTENIQANGQFVVHTVDEDLAEAMNLCAMDFPEGVDEATALGLTRTHCERIRPQRITQAPMAFECEKIAILQISPHRNILIGKVVYMHVRDGLMDPDSLHVDPSRYHPVGRMFGRRYVRTSDCFELDTPTYQEWFDATQAGRVQHEPDSAPSPLR